jgi:hypothetical protein
MVLFFLASIAGLFPGLILPLAVGWKAIHVFDVLFACCLARVAYKRAFRPVDLRLMAAGASVMVASGVALWAHPSSQGAAVVTSLAYSVVVLLVVAHVRIDRLGVEADRAILGPLGFAVAIAWGVFFLENFTAMDIGNNRSPMLPTWLHRLGGFTGGNALILFIALAAPLVRGPWWVLAGVLPAAFATLSRSLVGVGVGLLLGRRSTEGSRGADLAIKAGAGAAAAVGLFFYLVNVIPVDPTQRASGTSLGLGGYLSPHAAAVRMLASSPVTGVGPAGFAGRFAQFTSDEERARLPPRNRQELEPHSAILGLAAEQGLLGLAAFLWLLFEIFTRLTRIEDAELRRAAIAGLIGLLVGGHFVDWLALKGLWLWIGLLVASRSLDTR